MESNFVILNAGINCFLFAWDKGEQEIKVLMQSQWRTLPKIRCFMTWFIQWWRGNSLLTTHQPWHAVNNKDGLMPCFQSLLVKIRQELVVRKQQPTSPGVFTFIYLQYLSISAGQWLIAVNRIQNKSFCVHNICVCTVYIYCVYINTHTCMYIFKKNMLCLYIKYI